MTAFANDPRHVHYDVENNTVTASKILEWYRVDFPGDSSEALIGYLNTFRAEAAPTAARLTWFEYDWTVIRQP